MPCVGCVHGTRQYEKPVIQPFLRLPAPAALSSALLVKPPVKKRHLAQIADVRPPAGSTLRAAHGAKHLKLVDGHTACATAWCGCEEQPLGAAAFEAQARLLSRGPTDAWFGGPSSASAVALCDRAVSGCTLCCSGRDPCDSKADVPCRGLSLSSGSQWKQPCSRAHPPSRERGPSGILAGNAPAWVGCFTRHDAFGAKVAVKDRFRWAPSWSGRPSSAGPARDTPEAASSPKLRAGGTSRRPHPSLEGPYPPQMCNDTRSGWTTGRASCRPASAW